VPGASSARHGAARAPGPGPAAKRAAAESTAPAAKRPRPGPATDAGFAQPAREDHFSLDSFAADGPPGAGAGSSKGTPELGSQPGAGSQPPTVRQSAPRQARRPIEDANTNQSDAASDRGAQGGEGRRATPRRAGAAPAPAAGGARSEGQRTLDRFLGRGSQRDLEAGNPHSNLTAEQAGPAGPAPPPTAAMNCVSGGTAPDGAQGAFGMALAEAERSRGNGPPVVPGPSRDGGATGPGPGPQAAAPGADDVASRLGGGPAAAWREELAALREEARSLRLRAEVAETAAAAARAGEARAREELETLRGEAERLSRDRGRAQEAARVAAQELVVALGKAEREADELRLSVAKLNVGNVVSQRMGTSLFEAWEPGLEARGREKEKEELSRLRDRIHEEKRKLRKMPPPSAPGAPGAADGAAPDEWRVESMSVRVEALKRELRRVEEEERRVAQEQKRVIREIQRQKAQTASKFRNFDSLHDGRYVLLNLLGKGGFSEVFKAYDLHDMRFVACKIHQLGSEWTEDHKRNYIKHAVREYNIHRDLAHRHVVRLLDVFEVSSEAFATVMEICDGGDLDLHLKKHGALPEREAKAIAVQVLEALCYLNSPASARRVIHYDLKPPNILFDAMGEARVTDFGLSKEVNSGQTMGQELTSRGAGTYWYLPPECFEARPVISSKVDVYSLGCIVFQMVYGKKPFG